METPKLENLVKVAEQICDTEQDPITSTADPGDDVFVKRHAKL